MTDLPTDMPGVPVQYQMWITWALIAAKYMAELYSSVRAGGGLKRVVMAFWFGEQLPKVVAEDYKAELNPKEPK